MNKTDILQRIRETALIPVVRAESAELAMRAVPDAARAER